MAIKRRWTVEEVKVVKEMISKNYRNKDIAKKLNRSRSSLDNLLNRLGLTRSKGTNQYSFNKEVVNGMASRKHSKETKKKISESRKKYIMERHPSWKGGKRENHHGYVVVRMPNHPRAINGYIFEHILIMETILGRYLTEEEVVHHIDENKKNNSPENLMFFKNEKDHRKYHAFMRREREFNA